MKLSACITFLAIALCTPNSFANDISQAVDQGSARSESQNGGFLDIGAGLNVQTSLFYGIPQGSRAYNNKNLVTAIIHINGRYQYEGLFIEASSLSHNGVNMGYNFFNSAHWSADIIFSPIFGELHASNKDWEHLESRESFWGAGLRVSYFNESNIVQLRAITDTSGEHNGQDISLMFGHSWQVRNWNFYLLAGGRYLSDKVGEHYFSVSEDEAALTPDLSEHKGRGGLGFVSEVGVTYPLSENWIFRGHYRFLKIPSSTYASPLVIDDKSHTLQFSVSYVF